MSQTLRPRRGPRFRLVVAMTLLIAGCSSAGTVAGPVLSSPRPALFGAGGMDAVLEGTLAFDGDCLHLMHEDIEYPVVWPAGTAWQPEPPSVVLDGQAVEPGVTVSGAGGYLSRSHVGELAGSEVAGAAERCSGETGEIAFFNVGSEVEVTSG